MFKKILPCIGAALLSQACLSAAAQPASNGQFGNLTEARLAHAASEPDQWFTPGRDASGTYYSPLDAINDKTVGRLGFAWDYKLGTRRGLQGTPVMIDGILYASGNWGRVYALDAATGKEIWTYDPEVDGQYGRYACCDVVNRGVAVLNGKVFVGSIDGYLHAIDAKSGKRLWRADTLPTRQAHDFHYFITGAPLIAGNNIVIGNGGGDFAGARGFISAFDASSGKLSWRFFTVPRDPRLGAQDQPHLDKALETWPKDYDWSLGGGGSAWDGLAYDQKLNLVYLGTGNASPYHGENDPAGLKDELYVASIIAVSATSGKMSWYFQEIPGEGFDYDTTAKLTLAELPTAKGPRKVIMQASKNGFVYVLDRASGEFLSGTPFAHVNWAKGLDATTHRPIPNPEANWERAPALIYPPATGAHAWHPASYNPRTGLLYLPVIDAGMVYIDTTHRRAGLIEGNFDLAFFFPEDYDPKGLGSLLGPLPELNELSGGKQVPASRGIIRAFDPVAGKIVWETPTHSVWDGGILSTGGNLVIRGDAAGYLNAYAADSGHLIKSIEVGTSIMAAPMTYRVHGVQYVSVMAGYGGGVMGMPFPESSAAYQYGNEGRIVTFRLDGGAVPMPAPRGNLPAPTPPARSGSAATLERGEVLYNRFCSRCHAFGRGLLPDLRRMSPGTHEVFGQIVLKGLYARNGMARWDDVLSGDDAAAIHDYLIEQAWELNEAEAPAVH